MLGHEHSVNGQLILQEVINTIFDGVSSSEIADALIMATSSFIETDPAYNYVAAQFLLRNYSKKLWGPPSDRPAMISSIANRLLPALRKGWQARALMRDCSNLIWKNLARHYI